MTVTEICLVVIALCMLAITGGLVVLLMRLLPLARSVDALTQEGQSLVRRLHGVTGEIEAVVQDVRRVEERAMGVVRGVIDRIEPPLHQLAAVLTGVSAGIAALARLLPAGKSEPDRQEPRA